MADGDPLIIGQSNASQSRTLLERTSASPDAALQIGNNTGIGIGVFAQNGNAVAAQSLTGAFAAIQGTSMNDSGIVGQAGTNPPPFLAAVRAGVRGWSISDRGVDGQSADSNGVEGRSRAPGASGVYGQNDAGGFGVAGRTGGPGPAVFGDNTTGDGVQGHSRNGTGVVGQSFSTAVPENAFDIRSAGVSGIGPPVTATSPGVGGTGSPGVLGRPAPGNPVGNGVEGRSPRGWAGIFRGNVLVSGNATVQGTKSAAVPHPDGSTRELYAIESPDNWFEDFGRAELKEGHARVEIDPDFAVLVKTEDDYHVFLTPEGESTGLFVSNRTASSFEVSEQQQATGSLTFSYRIVARRKDVDTERLRKVDVPPPIPEGELLR